MVNGKSLIGSNWIIYIWAVNAGFIIETSMGYFISPLVSVFLGVFFLDEKLRRMQWLAVCIAGAGVLAMTVIYGQFPWISLYLAGSWGMYGFLRKKSPLASIEGLTLDTALLSLPVLAFLTFLTATGNGSFLKDWPTSLLLAGSGVISALPLVVYVVAARLVSLSMIGILQYIYPTLLFVVGAFIFNEPLSAAKMTGLIFIWIALAIYTIDSTIVFARREVAFKG